MDDKSFLKYHCSLLLNSINFSKGHPWKTKSTKSWSCAFRAYYTTIYFSQVTDIVRSISRPDVVCKTPLLARHTRPKGRPSAARDDRVSCIQHIRKRLRSDIFDLKDYERTLTT